MNWQIRKSSAVNEPYLDSRLAFSINDDDCIRSERLYVPKPSDLSWSSTGGLICEGATTDGFSFSGDVRVAVSTVGDFSVGPGGVASLLYIKRKKVKVHPQTIQKNQRSPTDHPQIIQKNQRSPTDHPQTIQKNQRSPTDHPQIIQKNQRSPTDHPQTIQKNQRPPTDHPKGPEVIQKSSKRKHDGKKRSYLCLFILGSDFGRVLYELRLLSQRHVHRTLSMLFRRWLRRRGFLFLRQSARLPDRGHGVVGTGIRGPAAADLGHFRRRRRSLFLLRGFSLPRPAPSGLLHRLHVLEVGQFRAGRAAPATLIILVVIVRTQNGLLPFHRRRRRLRRGLGRRFLLRWRRFPFHIPFSLVRKIRVHTGTRRLGTVLCIDFFIVILILILQTGRVGRIGKVVASFLRRTGCRSGGALFRGLFRHPITRRHRGLPRRGRGAGRRGRGLGAGSSFDLIVHRALEILGAQLHFENILFRRFFAVRAAVAAVRLRARFLDFLLPAALFLHSGRGRLTGRPAVWVRVVRRLHDNPGFWRRRRWRFGGGLNGWGSFGGDVDHGRGHRDRHGWRGTGVGFAGGGAGGRRRRGGRCAGEASETGALFGLLRGFVAAGGGLWQGRRWLFGDFVAASWR